MECQIIPEKCIACGLCQVYAPAIFDYDEEGIVVFVANEQARQITIDASDLPTWDDVTKAYRKCPVRAIEIAK